MTTVLLIILTLLLVVAAAYVGLLLLRRSRPAASAEDESDGSTVLWLTIIGSPSTPSRSESTSRRRWRSTHRLLALK